MSKALTDLLHQIYRNGTRDVPRSGTFQQALAPWRANFVLAVGSGQRPDSYQPSGNALGQRAILNGLQANGLPHSLDNLTRISGD
jgi:hypothetical protein